MVVELKGVPDSAANIDLDQVAHETFHKHPSVNCITARAWRSGNR
jgi:hypothetical protein